MPSSIGSSSLSKMVRVGSLGFEDESKKCTLVNEEKQVDTKKIKSESLLQRIESIRSNDSLF